MIYIILGPSGCGKGTQARLLSQKLNIPAISTGELIRSGAISRVPEALTAKEYADKGVWPPDSLVEAILSQALLKMDITKGLILDGSPRTVAQAKWLDGLFMSHGLSVSQAIHLETTLAESLKRIKGRISQEVRVGNLRSDETEEAIKERFESYNETIQPIKEYYDKQGKLVLVNNEQPIEDVHREICRKLNLL